MPRHRLHEDNHSTQSCNLTRDKIQPRFHAVNAQRLDNSGSVMFTLRYQGRSTEVSALVSEAVKDEILLSWRVLTNLGVIDSTFPNIKHTPPRVQWTRRMCCPRSKKTISQNIKVQIFPTGTTKLQRLPKIRRAQPSSMVLRTVTKNGSRSVPFGKRTHFRPSHRQS